MFDIQHDSPMPIHEQLAEQIRAHIATEALPAGARLAEYRALAQELLTNPQAVSRAYGALQEEGVLHNAPGGGMEVTPGAAVTCRLRLQDAARERLRQAVTQALVAGLVEAEIVQTVERAFSAAKIQPLTAAEARHAIKKPTQEPRPRASQGIQDLSR
jgi:GntR family transcriptional regulator